MDAAGTRVLSVDDSTDIAELSQRMLSRQAGIVGVGVRSSAENLVEDAVRLRADVVVLDLGMPGPDPLEAARALAERTDCRIVVMSGDDDPETVDRAIEAGASGFVSKHAEPADLAEAVRTVASGGMWLPRMRA